MSSNAEDPRDNGAVLNIAIFEEFDVIGSRIGNFCTIFLNSRQAIQARTTLTAMGHQHPPTPIQVDNTTVLGFMGKNITPKATNSTDMNVWWIRDCLD